MATGVWPLAPCATGCKWIFVQKDFPHPGDLVCEWPTILKCFRCGNTRLGRCNAVWDFDCLPCAKRQRRRLGIIGRSGFSSDRPEGHVALTLTAPGEDELPWDESKCAALGRHKHSGKIGCVVDEFAGAIWNGAAPLKWSRFIQELRRELGVNAEYFAVWEAQLREALHRHALLYVPGISNEKLLAVVSDLAAKHGFGSELVVDVISGSEASARAAFYAVKYVTKGSKRLVCLNPRTGEIGVGSYRCWSSSRRWGDSMGKVKQDAHAWVLSRQQGTRDAQSADGGEAAATRCALGAEGALDPDREIYTMRL